MFAGNKRKLPGAEARVEHGTFSLTITSIKNLLVVKNVKSDQPCPRLLEITLTDGKTNFKAIEWKRVNDISEHTPEGTIIVLHNAKFRGDNWLLEPDTIKEITFPDGKTITVSGVQNDQPEIKEAKKAGNEDTQAQTNIVKKIKVEPEVKPEVKLEGKPEAEVGGSPTKIAVPPPAPHEADVVIGVGDASFIEAGRPAPFPYIKEEWGDKTPKSYLMEWVQRFGKGQLPIWERVSLPNAEVEAKLVGEKATDKEDTSDTKSVEGSIDQINPPSDTPNTENPKSLRHAVKVIFPPVLGISPITTNRFYATMKDAEHTTSMVALAKLSELPQDVVNLHPEYVPPADVLPKRKKVKSFKPSHDDAYNSNAFRHESRPPHRGNYQDHRDGGYGWRNSSAGKNKKPYKRVGGGQYSTIAAVPPPKYRQTQNNHKQPDQYSQYQEFSSPPQQYAQPAPYQQGFQTAPVQSKVKSAPFVPSTVPYSSVASNSVKIPSSTPIVSAGPVNTPEYTYHTPGATPQSSSSAVPGYYAAFPAYQYPYNYQ